MNNFRLVAATSISMIALWCATDIGSRAAVPEPDAARAPASNGTIVVPPALPVTVAQNNAEIKPEPPAQTPTEPPTESATEPSMAAAEAQKLSDTKIDAIYKQIQDLVKQFYPRAQIKSTKAGLHFQFKVKNEFGYYSNRPVMAPQEGGISGDVALGTGAYGKPFEAEERDGFHTILTLAPFSKRLNHHVIAMLTYPTDVPNEFKEQFAYIVNGFAK